MAFFRSLMATQNETGSKPPDDNYQGWMTNYVKKRRPSFAAPINKFRNIFKFLNPTSRALQKCYWRPIALRHILR
eukprot:1160256-Pelagomonas_calceolata.AAC.28